MRASRVVPELNEAVPLGRVWPEHRASDPSMFMDAESTEGAGARAESDLSPLEVAEELLPFSVGWGAVFLAGP
jgi:hypothetical protein